MFAVLVAAISFASAVARSWFGSTGAIAAAAMAGLADAHASSGSMVSMVRGLLHRLA